MSARGLALFSMVLTTIMERDDNERGIDIAGTLLRYSPAFQGYAMAKSALNNDERGKQLVESLDEVIEALLDASSVAATLVEIRANDVDMSPDAFRQRMIALLSAQYEKDDEEPVDDD